MVRSLWLIMVAGCSNPPIAGTVVDGITSQPLPEFRLVARADADVSPTCAVVEATSDASGTFVFEGLCAGKSSYTVTSSNESWWFPDGAIIPQGATGALSLSAWQAPGGSGLFKLTSQTMERLKTAGDLKKDTVFGTDQVFYYPSEIPGSPPLIQAGEQLVIVGADMVNDAKLYALNPGPEAVKVHSSDSSYALLRSVSTIGLVFTGEVEFEQSGPISPDAAKTTTKQSSERSVRYLQADAVPPGRYAVFKEKDRRVYLVDFGPAPTSDEGQEGSE